MSETVWLDKLWQTRADWSLDETTGILTLPDPFDPKQTKKILVRESYRALLDAFLVMPWRAHINVHAQVVVGSPGIGKSMYLAYVAYRLLKNDKNVVIVFHNPYHMYRLDRTGCAPTNDLDPVLERESTWYLVDGQQPAQVRCPTVLSASSPDILRRIVKAGGIEFYMPPWSWDEIQMAQKHIFSDVPDAVVQRRFVRWGGVVRYVLQFARVESTDEKLDNALHDLGPRAAELMRSLRSKGGVNELPHLLFHLIPSANYLSCTVACASDYVADKLVEAAAQFGRWNLSSFLTWSAKDGFVAAARGMLFESWAHSQLCTGLTVNVRQLATGALSTWTLPRLTASQRPLLTGPPPSPGEYVRPVRCNEPAVDAMVRCDLGQGGGDEVLLLQMTVSGNHSVKRQAIMDAQKWATQSGAACGQLVFVVPPDVFATIGVQSYMNADGRVSKSTLAGVVQWALELPTTPAKATAAVRIIVCALVVHCLCACSAIDVGLLVILLTFWGCVYAGHSQQQEGRGVL